MSGYIGGDCVTEHALVVAENALHAVRSRIDQRPSVTECDDCGELINPLRLLALGPIGCRRCIGCQTSFDKRPPQKIKMLDRIL